MESLTGRLAEIQDQQRRLAELRHVHLLRAAECVLILFHLIVRRVWERAD